MKTKKLIYTALILIFSSSLLSAQEIDNNELAKRILTKAFNVKEGDVIVINGGQHTLDLLAAISMEASKLGAVVTTRINTDKITQSYFQDVPEKYYGNSTPYFMKWLKLVNVWINLPEIENYEAVYKNVSDEKVAKMNKANQSFLDTYNTFKIKGGYVEYPTKSMADVYKIDFEVFKTMQWNAINADYTKISENAKKIEKLLKASKKVEITTEKGTQLSFSVTGRQCVIGDGMIDKEDEKSGLFVRNWLSFPDGNIYVSAIENSGNGKVFVPKDVCNYEPLENVSFNVKNGKLSDYKAEKGGDCFMKSWNQYTGPKDMISGFQIGLNPGLKVMEDNAEYRPANAEGMVYIVFGDNFLGGGKNKVNGAYAYWFPITNATVKIDGKVLVKDGKLMLD
ncbi:MAG: aminopeptidase [Bacteroidales bacterium]